MTPTQAIALNRATALLNASGLSYAILQEDGTVLGNLEIQIPKKRKREKNKFPQGYFSKRIAPFMDKLKVGEQAIITSADIPLTRLHKSVSSRAFNLWGKGNSITHCDREKNHIEVIRVL